MGPKKVVYYMDARAQSPSLEFLRCLPRQNQQKVFAYISYLEKRGEELRRPIADYLGDKIYELRPKQIRILYGFIGKETIVILHAFRKKTDAVPMREKRLALERLRDFSIRHRKGLIALGGQGE